MILKSALTKQTRPVVETCRPVVETWWQRRLGLLERAMRTTGLSYAEYSQLCELQMVFLRGHNKPRCGMNRVPRSLDGKAVLRPRATGYDPLTGLRSHPGLLAEIARDSSLADRVATRTSIVVSVKLPESAGQKILALVGTRISRSIRAGDTAAHLGNGEFVVIVADDALVPLRFALRLKSALSLPCVIDGDEVTILYKIGFARLQRKNLLARSDALVDRMRLL